MTFFVSCKKQELKFDKTWHFLSDVLLMISYGLGEQGWEMTFLPYCCHFGWTWVTAAEKDGETFECAQ
jgi:hypothetical protein